MKRYPVARAARRRMPFPKGKEMVPRVGLEPTRLAPPDFESGVSTSSTTSATAPDYTRGQCRVNHSASNSDRREICANDCWAAWSVKFC